MNYKDLLCKIKNFIFSFNKKYFKSFKTKLVSLIKIFNKNVLTYNDQVFINIFNYTFYLTLIIIILILHSFVHMPNKNEKEMFVSTNYNDFISDDKYINLDLKLDGKFYNFDLKIPKESPTDMDIVDRLIYVITNTIKGDNKSLTNVTTNLNLVTKNSYGADIYYESKNGYIDTDNGDVLRPYAGEGNFKDILKVTVTYKDIKKVKEFKIIIIEDNISKLESDNNKLITKINDLNKNENLFNKDEKLTLPTTLNDKNLSWYYPDIDDENNSLELLVYVIIIYALLIFNEFNKEKSKRKKHVFNLENQFIDFVEDYILLQSAGFNISNAIKYINDRYKKDNELKHELIKMNSKLCISENPYKVLESFGEESHSSNVKRFVTTLIVNLKRGNSNLCELLKNELNLLNINKKYSYQKIAEENNIKALLPLMMILISTMIMVVYPAACAMNF